MASSGRVGASLRRLGEARSARLGMTDGWQLRIGMRYPLPSQTCLVIFDNDKLARDIESSIENDMLPVNNWDVATDNPAGEERGTPPWDVVMSIDARVHDVIETVYKAALDECHWSEALKKLADITDSQAATFWVLDGAEQPRLPTFIYTNLDPRFIEEYLDHMVPQDPTVQYLVRHPDQPIVHDGLVITEREKDRHPYYDWHGRHSDTRFRLVSQMRPAPAMHAGVALHRTRRAGRFEPTDIEQFAVLHRHIERALAVGFRLGTLGTLQQCTTEMLDGNSTAILFLDDHQRVVYANHASDLLRSDGDGISLTDAGVTLLHKQENDRLQALIASALALIAAPGADASMRVTRPSGKRPYLILVTPASRRHPVLSSLRPAVCIVITDPEAQRPLSVRRLRTVFGLTEAEARLAALLATGEDLRSAAVKLRISYGTARVRLSEIFQKTETHRQGELIKLLLATLTMG